MTTEWNGDISEAHDPCRPWAAWSESRGDMLSFAPDPVVIVNLIVNVIERRMPAVDYVSDYVDD